ncbi:MAG: HNH endonuclease [Elusimicrobia bacterium]|nr:HNH endonuclease [Elusimicrobiota bacterium]
MDDFNLLSDEELLKRLGELHKEERGKLPWFIACLGELDRRKALEKRGYSSTFDYCVRQLGLSEDEACRRIQAARAAVSRPQLLPALAEGRLSLTAVSRIAPHIRRPDAPEIIARAEGKSTRELECILAPLSPESSKRDLMRTIAVAAPGPGATRNEIKVHFAFQGSPALREAIERVRELLAHKFPFGGLNALLLVVVEDYLARNDPQEAIKLGRGASVGGSSAIAAPVRRAVWARDGGRCVYVGPGGVRCESRRMLEFDHRRPRSRGGENSVENLRLLCRPHNDAERRRILGEGKVIP